MGESLILSEEVTDLTTTYTDIACGNILVRADIAVELVHERLAETHHLSVALATGSKVGTALGTTHRKRGEGILEGLLEAEELHDTEIH